MMSFACLSFEADRFVKSGPPNDQRLGLAAIGNVLCFVNTHTSMMAGRSANRR